MNGDFREDLKRACEVMQKGGVILYPTDTIWGIGCDATNPEAVKRVYDRKKRADSKAMLVLVDRTVQVNFYVSDVPAVAWDLIEFTTKPLTIIYDGARNLAENLLAKDDEKEAELREEAKIKEWLKNPMQYVQDLPVKRRGRVKTYGHR